MSNEISTVSDDESVGILSMAPTAALAVQLAGAMVDKRIATARAYPRSITLFKKEAGELLKEDKETAASAEYAKPVGGSVVRGPSVRLAELAAMCWGNLDVEVCEPIVGEKSVTVMAYAWDLQRNYRAPGMASTSIIKRDGNRMPGHVIENLTLAAASKARRNAILNVIPKSYIADLLAIAKQVRDGNQKPMELRRTEAIEYFARSFKVTAEQIFEMFSVQGIDDLTEDHIEDLKAISVSIREGAKIEEFFATKTESKADAVKAKIAERKASAVPPNSTTPPSANAEKPTEPKPDKLTELLEQLELLGKDAISNFLGTHNVLMEDITSSKTKNRSDWCTKVNDEIKRLTVK